MKRTAVLLILIISIMSMSCFAEVVHSESNIESQSKAKTAEALQLGDYFTLGKYNNEPILWRYVANDENGKLIVSDKVLCNKPFGKTNFWKESFIRAWLNSSAAEGENEWSWITEYNTGIVEEDRISSTEQGFLCENNFSKNEKSAFKTVKQWTMIPEEYLNLATNGSNQLYTLLKVYRQGSSIEPSYFEFYDISEINQSYNGAAHELIDTVFLLDEMQLYSMWNNFGGINASLANRCSLLPHYSVVEYFLRTPDSKFICTGVYDNSLCRVHCDFLSGIRPAFYLDEENSYIKSGSGTEDDPYVMDGKEKTVYINNVKTETENPPVTYEGIVMVPMQETFEKLGANVVYDEETQAVTAELNGKYVYTLSDNKGILINGESGDMGCPMTMIMGMPYVPLSAIELSVTPNVLWDNELQQLNIVL